MTPLKGSHKDLKIIKVERLPWKKLDEGNVQHIAGGPYKGIIVNRAVIGQYAYSYVLSRGTSTRAPVFRGMGTSGGLK